MRGEEGRCGDKDDDKKRKELGRLLALKQREEDEGEDDFDSDADDFGESDKKKAKLDGVDNDKEEDLPDHFCRRSTDEL